MLYRPLNQTDIRLITIEPSDDPNSPVKCQLTHHNITEAAYTDGYAKLGDQQHWDRQIDSELWRLVMSETGSRPIDAAATATPATSNLPPFRYVWGDYMALSYTWGNPKIRQPIWVNGTRIDVTVSLYEALKALRSRPFVKAGWKIWIDALCINQGDIWERGTEVKRMGDIYKRAWTPIIWLGTAADDSDQAFDLIERLAPECDLPDQVIKLNRILKNDPYAFGKGSWRALHDLMARPYWRRAWIVQEGSLGKAVTPVICGEREMAFIHVYRVMMFMGRTDEILNIYMAGELAEVGRSIDNEIHRAIGVVSKIGEYQQQIEEGNKALELFSVIDISRSVAATDPRDKVYGLLALMPDELTQRINPDYNASVADVYADFGKLAIDLTGSLDILRHIAPPASDGNQLDLPSWVPDFTTPQQLCSLGSIPHRASGDTAPKVSYPRAGVLRARGFIIDTVDGLGCVWANGWPAETCAPAVNTTSNPYGTFEGAREAVWKTMCANRGVYTTLLDEDYSHLLAVPALHEKASSEDGKQQLLQIPEHGEDLVDLAGTHLVSYCLRAFAGNAEFTIAGRKMSEYFIKEPNFEALARNLPMLRHALNARDRINLYRRMFTTSEKGFVGIGMQEIQRGDVICILFGCSMPIVLRQVGGEGGGHWVVVGECYVHGVMEGEGLEVLRREEVQEQEFEIW